MSIEPNGPLPFDPTTAAPVGATTKALVASNVKIHLAQPPEMNGVPVVAFTFVLDNGQTLQTVALAQFFGLSEIFRQVEAEAERIMQELLVKLEAAEQEVKAGPVYCRCGKRIFGGAAERGYCLACGPEEPA